MTLIEVRTSSKRIGRCDARCYKATGPKCTCVCGGRNHGVGLRQAVENTKREAEEIVEKMWKINPDWRVVFAPCEFLEGMHD